MVEILPASYFVSYDDNRKISFEANHVMPRNHDFSHLTKAPSQSNRAKGTFLREVPNPK